MGRRSARGILAILVFAGLVAVPAGADAAPAPTYRYVALGDSWAAGTAAGTLDPATGTCRRSTLAYPSVLAQAAAVSPWTSRACAQRSPNGGNAQFAALSPGTRTITATVGADATGLGALAQACSAAGSTAACDAATARFNRALGSLPGALDSSLAEMRGVAPTAAITLTGYPALAEGSACAAGAADITRGARLDDAVARLNAVLADRSRVAGMRYVDVRAAFRGHGVCAAAPWIAPFTGAEALLAGSATANGHARGFAAALASTVRAALQTDPPPPSDPPRPSDATPPDRARSDDGARALFSG